MVQDFNTPRQQSCHPSQEGNKNLLSRQGESVNTERRYPGVGVPR